MIIPERGGGTVVNRNISEEAICGEFIINNLLEIPVGPSCGGI